MDKRTLIAVHRIAMGKPQKDGSVLFIEPGQEFVCNNSEASKLLESGAATKCSSPGTAKTEHSSGKLSFQENQASETVKPDKNRPNDNKNRPNDNFSGNDVKADQKEL